MLDEADRMLDMGFARTVRKVVEAIPRKRHTLLFSATMPTEITRMADSLLTDPEKVSVSPVSSTAEKVEQHLCLVNQPDKKHLLLHVLKEHPTGLIIVFMKMKHQCNKLVDFLIANGHGANAIHGNKSQGARERALAEFKSGKSRILVATDIAARGIDVKGIELVVNYELPDEPEAYVHRIGRTARAGRLGKAIAFCRPGRTRQPARHRAHHQAAHPGRGRPSVQALRQDFRATAHRRRPSPARPAAQKGHAEGRLQLPPTSRSLNLRRQSPEKTRLRLCARVCGRFLFF